MIKKIGLFCILTIFGLGFTFRSEASESYTLTHKQRMAYDSLERVTDNLFIDWKEQLSTPVWIKMDHLSIKWRSDNLADRTFQFLEEFGNLYNLENSTEAFVLKQEKKDALGMTHIVLGQKQDDIPVYAGELQFHFKSDGSLSSVNGTYIPNVPIIDQKKIITADQAVQIAAQALQKHLKFADKYSQQIIFLKNNHALFFYNHGLFSDQNEDTHLVWRVNLVSPGKNLNWIYYVDANTGEIVNSINNEFSADSRATYVMADCTDTGGTLVYNENEVALGTPDSQAEEVNRYMGYAYDYYATMLARDGYKGTAGTSTLTAKTHYEQTETDDDSASDQDGDGSNECKQYEGAAWDPDSETLSIGEDYYTLDIIGHEITHGVIQYASEDAEDTLAYEGESGALNESYADIFGELIELYEGGSEDWLLGEDLNSSFLGISGAKRNFADPNMSIFDPSSIYDDDNNYGQPSHTAEQVDVTDLICDSIDNDDNGCVHMNSGIVNNAFYLLVDGGTNPYSGENVTGGVDETAAANIYYRSLTEYLTTSSDFEDAYNATLQSCMDLYESDPTTYPLSYCDSVQQAFYAVGIASTESYLEADIVASTESGYAPLTVDFDGSDSFALNASITDYVWDLDSTVDSDSNGSAVDDVDNTGPIASYTYTEIETVNARLTIEDDTGNTTWSSVAITVANPIAAAFTTSGSVTSLPATITFDATSSTDATGTITDYSWDFGDGSTDTGSTASYTYSNPGTYTATLTVTDSNGYTSTASTTITVYASGTISSDTTWSADYSPYVISGGVTVASGSTLTIEPGTVIKFYDSTSSLTMNGTLDAQGSLTDSIVFTSYKDDDNGGDTNNDDTATSPAAGDWQQIAFGSSSITTLNYVTIQYGGQYSGYPSVYPMVYIQSDNVSINYNTISTSGYYNVYIDSSSPDIINSTLSNATGDYALYINGGSANIEGNTITENDRGIHVDSASPTIMNNVISENARYAVSIDDGSPLLTGNTISDSYYGVYIASGSPTLTNNTFSNHTYGVVAEAASSAVMITYNTVTGCSYYGVVDAGSAIVAENMITDSGYGIGIWSSSSIRENTISNNTNYGVFIVSGSPTLEENTINGNTDTGIYIVNDSTPTLFHNFIYDNTNYGTYNTSSTATIAAEDNWWGDASGPYHSTSNPSGTGDTVSDYVDFNPWLTSDDITPPSDVTLGTTRKDVWAQTITLNWTNPTDSDFDHVQIDRTEVVAGTTTTLSSSETGTSYIDSTPNYNTTYTYTLYAVDTTGNVSTGVTTSNQRLRNPTPTNLTLTAGDTTIAATWTASSAPAATLSGYIIYYGTSRTALTNSIDVGNTTATTITGLTNYTRYYVAVTAYNTRGDESAQSQIRATRPHP